jgi:hypothetical protein
MDQKKYSFFLNRKDGVGLNLITPVIELLNISFVPQALPKYEDIIDKLNYSTVESAYYSRKSNQINESPNIYLMVSFGKNKLFMQAYN